MPEDFTVVAVRPLGASGPAGLGVTPTGLIRTGSLLLVRMLHRLRRTVFGVVKVEPESQK